MASFEQALKEELNNLASLSGKVFPLNAPEGTATPYIVYESSEGVYNKTLMGFLPSRNVPVQLNIVAKHYSDMKTITSGVIQRLQSMVGTSIGASKSVRVFDIQMIIDPVETYETSLDMYICVVEFKAYL